MENLFVVKNLVQSLILCFCFTVLGHASEATSSEDQVTGKLLQLHVEGNRFVDSEGNERVLRGISISDPWHLLEQEQWNRRYFEELARWGTEVVRVPVHPAWMRDMGMEAYFELLDQSVQWCTDFGMYVIIDWHAIGNPVTGVPHHPRYLTTKEETFYFWHLMARRYKGNPVVAFFELYNEPTSRGGQFGRLDWVAYREFIEDLIYMIYRIDDSKIPLVGGLNWAYDLTDVRNDPVRYEGVAYVTHPYPQKRPAPWIEDWEDDWGYVADRYPVFATEFGFMGPDDPGAHRPTIGTEVYGNTLLDYFESKGISWTAWAFDPNWPPQLIKDWDFSPTEFGSLIRSRLLDGKQ